ncbi:MULTISPECIES: hypothetical protein [unclassified Streptomyces]|uniref:hypothetical protein n=1 Tax=unclassified Streptomyces TaxID=2593676 RepID=UPI002DDA0764|nr:hypothetical protein [Streptomyces sp. NBC_01766]WSC25012.1 hypothetical protein OIE60_35770 [Streptomyces sp. NBC_01766]WSV58386.1 hypothetical protein OG282_34590 [Streptomyces sp. NBC_01014]
MDSNPWFVVEDSEEDGEEPWDFDAGELAFIATLQARAASWRVPLTYSSVGRPEDDSSLLVHVSLSDTEPPLILGEWAVHFHGTYMRAGKVCDQLFNLHETPERGFLHASGTAKQLAEQCADWFETVLSRPVIRMEWLSLDSVSATGWAFADTAQALAGNVDHALAFASYSKRRTSHVRHHRCTLIRGASQPQKEPHAQLCPYELKPADSPTGRPVS